MKKKLSKWTNLLRTESTEDGIKNNTEKWTILAIKKVKKMIEDT